MTAFILPNKKLCVYTKQISDKRREERKSGALGTEGKGKGGRRGDG